MPPTDKINVVAGLYVAFEKETLTIADTAKSLTATKYTASDKNFAKRALMTCETAQIRYWYNGDDPTTSEGLILNPGSHLSIIGATNIRNFKAIRTGANSGVLQIIFEK